MTPQALGFFGWKRPQIAAKTLAALARCPGIERWPLIAFLDAGSDAHDDSWDVRLCRHPEARCVVPRLCHTLNIGTIDWTHTPGEDLTPDEWAGSENPRDIRQ